MIKVFLLLFVHKKKILAFTYYVKLSLACRKIH